MVKDDEKCAPTKKYNEGKDLNLTINLDLQNYWV